MWIANSLLIFVLVLTILMLFLFQNKKESMRKNLAGKISNGDENSVKVDIRNNYNFNINTKIIDEIPFQFQKEISLSRKILKVETIHFSNIFWNQKSVVNIVSEI
jgi:nitrogenase subunit NifH